MSFSFSFLRTKKINRTVTGLNIPSFYFESENVSSSVVSDSLQPPRIIACQAFLSIEFSKQEYWSG